jgi:hypothetical protein
MPRLLRLACLLPLAFLPAACGRPGGAPAAAAGPAASAPAARPAPPAPDAPHSVNLRFSGGRFAQPVEIAFPFDPQAGDSWEALPGGARLVITSPGSDGDPLRAAWGFWLFVAGVLREEDSLALRTGSQILIDGMLLAPAAAAGRAATADAPALDAKLTIDWIDLGRGEMEAEISGSFLEPDGTGPVAVTGLLRLPLPRRAAD